MKGHKIKILSEFSENTALEILIYAGFENDICFSRLLSVNLEMTFPLDENVIFNEFFWNFEKRMSFSNSTRKSTSRAVFPENSLRILIL